MSTQLEKLGMGARFISADQVDLGPLQQLIGEWESVVLPPDPGSTTPAPSGWNLISVPGEGGFVFEIIPYKENLKFSAVAVEAGNRGPVLNGTQFNQEITGLFYEQQIISICDSDFCNTRGFSNGTVIHAETGLILYITNYSSGLDIARLGTVPHGNALLALGNSNVTPTPGTTFFPTISPLAFNLDGSSPAGFGYNENIILDPQFPNFKHVDPNSALQSALQQIVGKGSVSTMTTIDLTTKNPDASGGILNIPFIQTNVTATTMDATFWLETITGGSETELLQYSQTINLVFPLPGTVTPIVWPHITVSTLKRMQTPNAKSHVVGAATPGVPQL
jgi:hypothetical protein